MNIEQLDRLFTAITRKHHVTTFVVMVSLTVLGLINERKNLTAIIKKDFAVRRKFKTLIFP